MGIQKHFLSLTLRFAPSGNSLHCNTYGSGSLEDTKTTLERCNLAGDDLGIDSLIRVLTMTCNFLFPHFFF